MLHRRRLELLLLRRHRYGHRPAERRHQGLLLPGGDHHTRHRHPHLLPNKRRQPLRDLTEVGLRQRGRVAPAKRFGDTLLYFGVSGAREKQRHHDVSEVVPETLVGIDGGRGRGWLFVGAFLRLADHLEHLLTAGLTELHGANELLDAALTGFELITDQSLHETLILARVPLLRFHDRREGPFNQRGVRLLRLRQVGLVGLAGFDDGLDEGLVAVVQGLDRLHQHVHLRDRFLVAVLGQLHHRGNELLLLRLLL